MASLSVGSEPKTSIGMYRKALRLARENRFSEAYSLLDRSCQYRYGPACYALGTWKLHGRGCRKDVIEAFTHFKDAVRLGFVGAKFDLAICYERGEGTKKSVRRAAKLYAEAAAAGDQSAFREVARTAYWGIGRRKDLEVARQYYIRAARAGDAESAFALAHLYEFGEGGRKDSKRAAAWRKRGAALKGKYANRKATQLKKSSG